MENKDFEETLDASKVISTPSAIFLICIAVASFLIIFFGGFLIPGASDYVYLLFIPMMISMLWLAVLYNRAVKNFWKTMALKYGWEYRETKDVTLEKGLMLNIGYNRQANHTLNGSYKGHPFCIFEYSYTIGSGKSKSTNYLLVFEIKFEGTFPHIFLDYIKDWSFAPIFPSNVAKISLPKEFSEIFRLFSPREYEIETLHLFTPDVFQHFIDMGWEYDLEFIDSEIVIYNHVQIRNFEALDQQIKKIEKIIDLLSPKLNKMKITPIGDIPHTLR